MSAPSARGDAPEGDAELLRPTARTDADATAALARHRARAEAARRGRRPIDLLFFGDSLVRNWAHPRGGLWPWLRHFGAWDGAVFGVGNDRTSHMLSRIVRGTLDGLAPRVVVVSAGANQLAREYSVDGVAASILAVADAIRDRLPSARVVVSAVLPQDDGWEWNPIPKVRAINAALRARVAMRADGEALAIAGDAGAFVADGDRLDYAVFHDGVHLTPAGYARWARQLAPVVHTLAPPLDASAPARLRRILRAI